jgi:hypothetical protein
MGLDLEKGNGRGKALTLFIAILVEEMAQYVHGT